VDRREYSEAGSRSSRAMDRPMPRHPTRFRARANSRSPAGTSRWLSRSALDDPPVLGLRHRGGIEPALPLPARTGRDGALRGARSPDPVRLRLRRRGGERGGRSASASRSTRSPTSRCCSTASPLDRISTSFTINGTAAILLAFYVAAAERQGRAPREADRARSRTTSSRSTPPGEHRGSGRRSRRCA
jgi:hypothetical protein